MREILNMIIVLSTICGLSGFALSYLKQTTSPIIEEQVLTFVQGPAIKAVYPDADNDPIAERKTIKADAKEIIVFPYKKGGKLVGIALEGKGNGYGGDLGVMVGIDVERDVILGIGVTETKETPGIGDSIGKPKFGNQFKGKAFDVLSLTAQGGKIDAVSGATISSKGALEAVNNAVALYKQQKDNIIKSWQ